MGLLITFFIPNSILIKVNLFLYRLKVLSVLELPEENILKAQKGCPNLIFPSDHLRIEAVFEAEWDLKEEHKL